MPVQNKLSWARLKVGLMALASLIILVIVIVLVTGDRSIFAGNSTIYTYMNDATALAEGAPVTLNGFTVGKVAKVELSGLKDPQKIVKITMEVQDKYMSQIPSDSVTELTAPNLLGTKFVNITKGKSPTLVPDGGTLPTLNTAGFEDVVKQGYAVLTSLQGIVDRADKIVGMIENGQGSIGKLLVSTEMYDRLLAIINEADQIGKALNNGNGTVGKLIYDPALYNDLRGSVGRMDSLLDGLQKGEGTAGKLLKDPTLYNQLQKTVTDLDQIVTDLNAGKGTAGKLLKSDELANQLSGTVNRIDVLLDKVNAGQGTLGQLLVNQQLFDNLNGTAAEMHGLMKDFRSNPKKFLRIKLSIF